MTSPYPNYRPWADPTYPNYLPDYNIQIQWQYNCPHCGQLVMPNYFYCPFCGTSLGAIPKNKLDEIIEKLDKILQSFDKKVNKE